MPAPIDILMDRIEWVAADKIPEHSADELYATHSGFLVLGNQRLKCYRLNDGSRVIDVEDMNRFFGEG